MSHGQLYSMRKSKKLLSEGVKMNGETNVAGLFFVS